MLGLGLLKAIQKDRWKIIGHGYSPSKDLRCGATSFRVRTPRKLVIIVPSELRERRRTFSARVFAISSGLGSIGGVTVEAVVVVVSTGLETITGAGVDLGREVRLPI